MPNNNRTVAENKTVVMAGLAEGKTTRQIAEETGLSKSYVAKISKENGGNEWAIVGKDPFIQDLVHRSFGNVDLSIDIETKFLNQLMDKSELTAGDTNIASQIGERNQKRGTILAGDNVNKDGGEKALLSDEYKDRAAELIGAMLAQGND